MRRHPNSRRRFLHRLDFGGCSLELWREGRVWTGHIEFRRGALDLASARRLREAMRRCARNPRIARPFRVLLPADVHPAFERMLRAAGGRLQLSTRAGRWWAIC